MPTTATPMIAVPTAYHHTARRRPATAAPTNAPTATSCPMAMATDTQSAARWLEDVDAPEQQDGRGQEGREQDRQAVGHRAEHLRAIGRRTVADMVSDHLGEQVSHPRGHADACHELPTQA